ncbi:putative peptidoglycan lipid II flippase [Kitasatospora sp. MAA4]|uniref:murein biosynthesis integral membrane protein MurJ n=1 Tax=Kitasatospora sp. MAA4 TaxID=3035093 RepID=UPI00247706BF|nr:murein biosynthesis integral membrane protein MurJ [Kitasatospora sp. MAA4]MDH6134605.1 putative peptidoglycan lipid II flippase [Kitasatospora sp. MAA4]
MSGPRDERVQGQERGRGRTDSSPAPGAAPADEQDWYLADTYAQDPFAADPYPTVAGPDPYDRTADEPPAPPSAEPVTAAEAETTLPDPQESPAAPAAPEPTVPASRWAGRAALAARNLLPAAVMATGSAKTKPEPEPEGSPWDSESTEYVGVDALLSGVGAGHAGGGLDSAAAAPPEKPFIPVIEFDPPLTAEEAELQLSPAPTPAPSPALEPEPEPEPAAPESPSGGPQEPAGKVAGLLNSSAIMAAGTLVSRGTGFVRTMVIAAAIGVGTMGDSYSAANTLPTLLYILIGGGALNAVFVPQLVRSMKQDEDGGTAYANRLLTLVMVGLAGVAFVAVLAAPLLVQLISHSLMRNPTSADTTVALARYCLPTIFFMGVHVVMGQILNARGRFGAMMWTPVLNNVVVIFTFGMYLWVFGTFESSRVTPESISPEGLRLLGIGTLLGLTVQALAMIPYLRAAGFQFRPRFDWRGHGLGKAARLAKWTFLFVLANQAGYLVVTQLATAAGSAAASAGYLGVGLAAYSNALLIWQLPMAVITVSVMSAVLPRLSRSAADGDAGAVRDDLSYGLRTSAVAIVPASFLFLALGPQIGSAIYGLGNGGSASHGTTAVGLMLSAFALGLIPYSVQYVLLRGFYAYEDTRTPFSNTVWVAAAQAGTAVLCYLLLPAHLAVTGMALGYGASYAVGVAVAVPKLKRRIGGLDTGRIAKTYARLAIACLPAALAGFLVALLLGDLLNSWLGSVVTVLVAGTVQLAVFTALARRMRIEELNAMIGMVRSRLGR